MSNATAMTRGGSGMGKIIDIRNYQKSKSDEEKLRDLYAEFDEVADRTESHVLQMNLRSDNGASNS